MKIATTGLVRGIQGTESLWLDSQLSEVDVPSRDWSPGGNRGFVQGQPKLNQLIIEF